MTDRTPLTRAQYQQMLDMGVSPDEMQTRAVIIPDTPTPAQGGGRSLPSMAPSDQTGISGAQDDPAREKLIPSLLNPKRWGQSAVAAADFVTGGALDEAVAGVMGGGHNRKKVREWLNAQDQQAGYLGGGAKAVSMLVPYNGIGSVINAAGRTVNAARGGVAGARALGPAGAAVEQAARLLPAWLQRAVVNTGTGAAIGGTAGAFSAEPGDRMRGMKTGATVGGATGLAIGAASDIARGVQNYAGLRTKALGRERASEALNTQRGMVRDPRGAKYGDTPNEVDRYVSDVQAQASDAPSSYRLMDTSPEARELTRNTAILGTDAERNLERIARQRIAEEGRGVEQDVNQALGVHAPLPHANQESRQLEAIIRRENDAALNPIWQQHPDPITDPPTLEAWRDIRTELAGIPNAIESRQVLSRRNNGPAIQHAMDASPSGVLDARGNPIMLPAIPEMPNLKAVHEAKQALQTVISAIRETPNPTELQALQLPAFQAAKDRLAGMNLARVPGGAAYQARMEEASKQWLMNDQLHAGQEIGKKLGTMPHEDVTDALRGVVNTQIHGQPIDPTTAQNALQATRHGVASQVRQEIGAVQGAIPGEAGAVLDKMRTRNVRDNMVPLAGAIPGGTQQSATAAVDRMQNRLSQRQEMRVTNRQQIGKETAQREILKGSRGKGTAAAFGEGATLGGLATASLPIQAMKLTAGAKLARVLEGRRSLATDAAAEELHRLLAMDPRSPGFLDAYRATANHLRDAQMQRMARQAGRAGAASMYTARQDK